MQDRITHAVSSWLFVHRVSILQNGGVKEGSHLMGSWKDAKSLGIFLYPLTCLIHMNHVSSFVILRHRNHVSSFVIPWQGSSFLGIESSCRLTTPTPLAHLSPYPRQHTHIATFPASPHLIIKSSSGLGNIFTYMY